MFLQFLDVSLRSLKINKIWALLLDDFEYIIFVPIFTVIFILSKALKSPEGEGYRVKGIVFADM